MSRDVEKMFYVYLVADRSRVLSVGFTSNLRARVIQHREGWFEGFTKSYDCHRLGWFERFFTASAGIAREKQIKRWRREKKVALIERENPTWRICRWHGKGRWSCIRGLRISSHQNVQTADFSTAAASAPPSGEMTGMGLA